MSTGKAFIIEEIFYQKFMPVEKAFLKWACATVLLFPQISILIMA